jgi:hypothetical protein
MKKLASDSHLYFTVKGVQFKMIGTKRDNNGNFDLIHIKNCETKTYKWIQRKQLEKILDEL